MSEPALDPADTTWSLGAELGRGALGRVVRVQGSDGRTLAGKLLHRSLEGEPRARARFEAEARLLTGVSHPNLVGIHGLVEIGGERVLLMDLVDGPTLATLVAREAPLHLERAVALVRGIAAGLTEAHRQGLVHRDLKPANVKITPDGGATRVLSTSPYPGQACSSMRLRDAVISSSG